MKRQTQTLLGNLRIGDRFYLISDKKPVVREVISRGSDKVRYNKIQHGTGKYAWLFDRSKSFEEPVMFIRHTDLLPGDECFMYELKDGDVFTIPGNKKELRRVKELQNKRIAVRYVGNPVHLYTDPLTTGIFVRRSSLKTIPIKDVQ